MTETFMALRHREDKEQQIQLLSGHRRHLLEQLHREEKQIEYLDYLLYLIQKNKI